MCAVNTLRKYNKNTNTHVILIKQKQNKKKNKKRTRLTNSIHRSVWVCVDLFDKQTAKIIVDNADKVRCYTTC